MSEFHDNIGLDLTGALRDGPQLPAHVYVHVPFCRVKCSYCDFYSVSDLEGDRIESVLRGIEAELTQWGEIGLPGVVETVYVGGGTPTVIVGGAVRIVRAALEEFPVRAGAEVTVEANPDSVTPALMEALAAVGTTRVSLGVQSFVEKELGLLGRVHTVDEASEACRAVRQAGLGLSIDLMCGIPGQTKTSWTASLERAVTTGADHISVYPLTLEPGTPLEVAVSSGLVDEPDPDLAADLMVMAEEFLGMADIERYEVSNYARSGHESRHNMAYWTGRSYLGIGPAAHGMLDAETALVTGLINTDDMKAGIARVRYASPPDIDEWLTSGVVDLELLNESQTLREDAMLGLRLVRGISHVQALGAGVEGALTELEVQGLVERITASGRPVTDEAVVPSMRWRTTRRGWLLGNEVFGKVLGE